MQGGCVSQNQKTGNEPGRKRERNDSDNNNGDGDGDDAGDNGSEMVVPTAMEVMEMVVIMAIW